MDMITHTFARRARLSRAAIMSAIAVTIAALAAILYSVGEAPAGDLKIESPIRSNVR